jgi:hypothetical protein
MRGLDPEERYTLSIIERQDFESDVDARAADRCAARGLYLMVVQTCPNCGGVHEIPVLTSQGRLAIVCDRASRTLEIL